MGFQDTFQGFFDALGGGGQNLWRWFETGAAATIWFWFKVFLGFAICIGIGVVIYKFYLQYRIRITIWRKIGAGWESKNDMAKVVMDKQGKRKFQLLKTRNGKSPITTPVPESQFLSKIGKKDHYAMFLDNNFQLHPIELPEVDMLHKSLKVSPQDRTAWSRFEDRIISEKFKKKSLVEVYLPAGIILVACICAFLLFFFGFKETGSALRALADQFAQVAASCTKLG